MPPIYYFTVFLHFFSHNIDGVILMKINWTIIPIEFAIKNVFFIFFCSHLTQNKGHKDKVTNWLDSIYAYMI